MPARHYQLKNLAGPEEYPRWGEEGKKKKRMREREAEHEQLLVPVRRKFRDPCILLLYLPTASPPEILEFVDAIYRLPLAV